MFRCFRWALVVLAVPLCLVRADNEPKKASAKPQEVVALFHDGTKVRMQFLQENLEVVTKYGKLVVPASDIRRIDFGFRLTEDNQRRLDTALKNLNSNNFQDREASSKDLLALGRLAYPALVKMSKSNDLETTRRVEDILKAIRTKVPAEQLRSRTEDMVHTQVFSIAGRIELATLRAKTEHFGEVELKVVELRTLHSTAGGGDLKVAIDAGVYGSQNTQWLDTGFVVQADVPLVITASGEVDLYGVQSPGNALSGPDGNRSYNRGGQHTPGTLLGRIGEDGGEIIVIGRRYEKTPTVEGKLYLRIAPLPGSGGATGNYSVQISAGGS